MSRRTATAATLAAAALTLTACTSTTHHTSPNAVKNPAAVPTATAPATELTVGQTYRYPDGLKVSVTAITTITKYTADEHKPAADETAFLVHLKVTNGTKTPQDLDHLPVSPVGATNGGDATMLVNSGEQPLSGRLAPGKAVAGTSAFTIGKSHGRKLAVGVYRGGLGADPATVPVFTGTIQ